MQILCHVWVVLGNVIRSCSRSFHLFGRTRSRPKFSLSMTVWWVQSWSSSHRPKGFTLVLNPYQLPHIRTQTLYHTPSYTHLHSHSLTIEFSHSHLHSNSHLNLCTHSHTLTPMSGAALTLASLSLVTSTITLAPSPYPTHLPHVLVYLLMPMPLSTSPCPIHIVLFPSPFSLTKIWLDFGIFA